MTQLEIRTTDGEMNMTLEEIVSAVASLKATTLSMVYAHYKDLTSIPQNRMDPQNEICHLWDCLESLSSANGGQKKVSDLKALLDVLLTVCKIHAALQGLDGMLELGETVGASAAMLEITSLMTTLHTDGTLTSLFPTDLYTLLQDQVIVEKARQKSLLLDLSLVGWAFGTSPCGVRKVIVQHKIRATPTLQFYDNPVLLEDVFISLRDLNLLSSCCSHWASSLLQNILTPLLKDPLKWTLTVKKSKLQTSLSLVSVSSVSSVSSVVGDGAKESKLSLALDRVLQVCRFIHDHVFRVPPPSHSSDLESDNHHIPSDHPMRVFGTQLTPHLVQALTQDVLYPSIPTDLASLDAFAKEAGKCLMFEEEMKMMGFVTPGSPYPLQNSTLHNLRSLFFKKRTTEVLAMARDILLSDDATTVVVNDATERSILTDTDTLKKAPSSTGKKNKEGLELFDNPLKFESCQVTVPTQTLVELVYQTLVSAEKETDPESSAEFYFAARDMIDLYRALVPTHHSSTLSHSLPRSLLFYTDSLYLTHHLVTLGQRFQRRALEGVEVFGLTATFLDVLFLIREAGEEVLVNQMTTQHQSLLTLFTHTLTSLTPHLRDEAFQKFLFSTSQFCTTTRQILPLSMYCKCIGSVVSGIITTWMTEGTMDRVEREYYMTLFKTRVKEEWFEWTVGYGHTKEVVSVPVHKFVPEWEAFLRL